eukprot:scaffold1162_cov22-Phaeocystis_antarctica.AAC.1
MTRRVPQAGAGADREEDAPAANPQPNPNPNLHPNLHPHPHPNPHPHPHPHPHPNLPQTVVAGYRLARDAAMASLEK